MKAIGKQYNTRKTKQSQIKEAIKRISKILPPGMRDLLTLITRLISFGILLY